MYGLTDDRGNIEFLCKEAKRFARKYGQIGMFESDDIAQAAVIRLIEKCSKVPQPVGWLRKTIHTVALDMYRRETRERKRFAHLDDPNLAGVVCERADEEGYVHTRNTYVAKRDSSEPDVMPRLEAMLAQLRPQLRQVLLLYANGYSYQQMAEEVRVPVGTIRSRLFHARQQAQQTLGEI